MSRHLPISDFKWASPERFTPDIILQMRPDQETGFVLCVDLLVPDHLHDKLNCLPPAPDHRDIDFDTLSPFSQGKILQLCVLTPYF